MFVITILYFIWTFKNQPKYLYFIALFALQESIVIVVDVTETRNKSHGSFFERSQRCVSKIIERKVQWTTRTTLDNPFKHCCLLARDKALLFANYTLTIPTYTTSTGGFTIWPKGPWLGPCRPWKFVYVNFKYLTQILILTILDYTGRCRPSDVSSCRSKWRLCWWI